MHSWLSTCYCNMILHTVCSVLNTLSFPHYPWWVISIVSVHSLQFSKGYRQCRCICVQNCDKSRIILKNWIYVSKALTPWPLEIKAFPRRPFLLLYTAGSSLSESLKENIIQSSITCPRVPRVKEDIFTVTIPFIS